MSISEVVAVVVAVRSSFVVAAVYVVTKIRISSKGFLSDSPPKSKRAAAAAAAVLLLGLLFYCRQYLLPVVVADIVCSILKNRRHSNGKCMDRTENDPHLFDRTSYFLFI